MNAPDKVIQSNPLAHQAVVAGSTGAWGESVAPWSHEAAGRPDASRRWKTVFVLWVVLTVSAVVQQIVVLQRLDIAQMVTDQYTAEVNRRLEAGDTTANVVPAEITRRQAQARFQQKWGWAPNLIVLPLGYLMIGTIYFGLMKLLGAAGSFRDYQWGTAMSYLPATLLLNFWTTIKAASAETLTKAAVEKLPDPFVAKAFFPGKLSPLADALLDSLTLFNALLVVLAIYYLRRVGRTNTARAVLAVAVLWIGYIGIKLIIVGMVVPQTCETCAALH